MTNSHGNRPSQPIKDDSIGRIAELIGGNPVTRLDSDMKHVLDGMARLGARPLEVLTPEQARSQPRASEAISAILGMQSRQQPDDGVTSEDIQIAGGDGLLDARIYRPMGLLSRLNPVILYFHGGGFVTGDLNSHDASARGLARRSGAIVVSVAYRLAPEHPFPAAHDDAWAAWQWLLENAHTIAGDPSRLAIAGEDAGGNLAFNVALRARDSHGPQPVHQVLVHPIAGSDLTTASYGETLRARPIGLPGMRWRFRHLFAGDSEGNDNRINLSGRSDFSGLTATTIVLAEIDPLRSEGEALAEALEAAGVATNCWTYEGVTQGFFGLGQVVTKALFAQSDAADALGKAFAPGRRS